MLRRSTTNQSLVKSKVNQVGLELPGSTWFTLYFQYFSYYFRFDFIGAFSAFLNRPLSDFITAFYNFVQHQHSKLTLKHTTCILHTKLLSVVVYSMLRKQQGGYKNKFSKSLILFFSFSRLLRHTGYVLEVFSSPLPMGMIMQ